MAHQINAGLNHGYKEEEVIEAVIRVLNPGLRLRSYLGCKFDLTLANLCKILRSHHQEKEATQDFLVCLLDLEQKILFASKEADSDLKYEPKLVQCLFSHSLLTGLRSDSIKLELTPRLQNTHVTDEELFEN